MRYQGIELFIVAVAAAWLIGFGAAGAKFAVRKRRRPRTWAAFGAILGPAALALLELAPPGHCWTCASPTEGWITLCRWCGEDVRGPAVAERAEPRVLGPLTVIEGTAPRNRADDAPAAANGRTTRSRGRAGTADARAVTGRRATDPAARERRVEVPRPPYAEPPARVAASAARPVLETTADPVHRLKARLGRAGQSLATAEVIPAAPPEPRNLILASAIYVTGSRGLQAGSRYGIALVGDDLQILGPVDIDPTAVTIVHSLRGIDATGLQGRLIITGGDGRRDRLALVFMSVAGGSPEGVADAIVAAAADVGTASR